MESWSLYARMPVFLAVTATLVCECIKHGERVLDDDALLFFTLSNGEYDANAGAGTAVVRLRGRSLWGSWNDGNGSKAWG